MKIEYLIQGISVGKTKKKYYCPLNKQKTTRKLDIKLNTGIEKVLSTSKDFNSEIENINKDFKVLQDRVYKIRNAKKKIDEILGSKEKDTVRVINKDIER